VFHKKFQRCSAITNNNDYIYRAPAHTLTDGV